MQIDFTKFVRAQTLVRGQPTPRPLIVFTTEIGRLAVAKRGGDWRLTFGTATKPDYGLVETGGFAARRLPRDVPGRLPPRRRDRVARAVGRSGARALRAQGLARRSARLADRRTFPWLDPLARLRARPRGLARVVRARFRRAGLRAWREVRPARPARTVRHQPHRGRARGQHRAFLQVDPVRVGPEGRRRGVGRPRQHAGPCPPCGRLRPMVAPQLRDLVRGRDVRPVPVRRAQIPHMSSGAVRRSPASPPCRRSGR